MNRYRVATAQRCRHPHVVDEELAALTVDPAFPTKPIRGTPRSPQELAEICYVRIYEDLHVCRALDFMKEEAILEVIRAQRPILVELAGERADALKTLACGLATLIWRRPIPESDLL